MALSRALLSCVVLLALGCDGGTTPPGDAGGGGGALVGTWGTTACVGPDTNSCDLSITFGAGGDYSIRNAWVKDPGAEGGFEDCTITLVATGFTWTSTATTYSVAEGPSPGQTVMRTGCSNPDDDEPTPIPSETFTAASYTSTDTPYSISGNELTLGGFVLTRR